MIRALGPEILLNSPKGLENLKRVTKASKKIVYGVEKGCPTHWYKMGYKIVSELATYSIVTRIMGNRGVRHP